MKLSFFNYFLPVGEDVVCTNLLTGHVFVIEQKKKQLIDDFSHDISALSVANPGLYSLMCKTGILVPAGADESNIAQYNLKSTIYNPGMLRLTVLPTLDCNYNCWYCYEKHPKGRMSEELVESIIKLVRQQLDTCNLSGVILDWFGGEPLMCFKNIMYPLSKAVQELTSSRHLVFNNQITTNGYLIKSSHCELYNEIHLRDWQITLDGDETEHQKIKKNPDNDSYKVTVANIISLCKQVEKANVTLRINFSDDTLKSIKNIVQDFPREVRSCITVMFQRIWQLEEGTDFSDEVNDLLAYFEQQGFKVVKARLNYQGYPCYANLNHQAVITPNGDVFKCTARDFTEAALADGTLGVDGEIKWNANYYKRMTNLSMENDHCLSCQFLPVCCGPCSQKYIEHSPDQFEGICNKEGVKLTLNNQLKDVYAEQYQSPKQVKCTC